MPSDGSRRLRMAPTARNGASGRAAERPCAARRAGAAGPSLHGEEHHAREDAPFACKRWRMAQAHARCSDDGTAQGAPHRDIPQERLQPRPRTVSACAGGSAEETHSTHRKIDGIGRQTASSAGPGCGPASGLKSLPHGTLRRAIRRMRHATNPGTAFCIPQRWQRGTDPSNAAGSAAPNIAATGIADGAPARASARTRSGRRTRRRRQRTRQARRHRGERARAGFSPPTPARCGTCAATAPRPATRPDAS